MNTNMNDNMGFSTMTDLELDAAEGGSSWEDMGKACGKWVSGVIHDVACAYGQALESGMAVVG